MIKAETKESGEMFRRVFELHNAIMLLIDSADGRIVDANKAAEKFYGYSRSDLSSMNMQEINLYTPEQIKTAMLSAQKGTKNFFMFPHRLASGEMVTIEAHSTLISVDGKELLFSIIHDISKRKLVEDALLESEAKYRSLFDKAMNGIFIYDPETMIIFDANPVMSEIYGYGYEELIGMNCLELSAEVEESIKASSAAHEDGRFKVKIRWHKKKDGTFFPLELDGYKFVSNGKAVGCAVVNDITERKEVEDKVRDSEEMFKSLFDQTMGHTMLLQPTSSGIPTILDVNRAACKAHSWTRDELIGRPVSDLDDEEGKRVCIERTKHIMAGETLALETNHVRKDGSIFPVEVYANLVHLTNKPPLILTTEYDITQRKRIELELEKAKSEVNRKNKKLEEANVALNFTLKQQENNKEELERSTILLNESNIALKVLLKQREEDRDLLEKNVLFNVEKLLTPTLEKLKMKASDNTQKTYLNILEWNLNQIVLPFMPKVANHLSKLTPAQIQVANLIKQGMSTKEIAYLLNLSPATIAAQRQNIRKRLALTPKTSLRTFLMSNE
jgi:PAS domain S-box-containing protein